MSEGADSGLAPSACGASSRRASNGFTSTRSTSISRTWRTGRRRETIGVFEELVAAGSIRAYGGSNVDGAWLEQALGLGSPAWVQNSFSLLDRADETDVLPVIARGRLHAVQPAGRRLADRQVPPRPRAPSGSRMTLPRALPPLEDERVFDALDAFAAAAHERETTPAALAIRGSARAPPGDRGRNRPAPARAAPPRARRARARPVAARARAAGSAFA